jgi:DNA-binding transcriptional LysR family regulator
VDRLTSMTVFARVAAARSFSTAARELGISQATASKHVQTLERWLGTRLLHRTTRRVALTDTGEVFLAQCSRILEDIDDAANIARPQVELRGSLRLAASVEFGSRLLGLPLAEFAQQHPQLTVSVDLFDRQVDLIEEGYDVAIRVNLGARLGVVAFRLMPLHDVVCAAPAYLNRRGVPSSPADLMAHRCIAGMGPDEAAWRFTGAEGAGEVAVEGNLIINSAMLRRDAALAGAGVMRCADFLVENDIAEGRLVRLLEAYPLEPNELYATCPAGRAASPKIRSLIAHLQSALLARSDGSLWPESPADC